MNDKKLVIHTPDKIDREVEDFKLDSFEGGKNYSATKIKLTRDVETEKPVLWYSQELIRNHRDPTDPFGKRQILKPFTASNLEAVSDETLTQKFTDTVLAFKEDIPDYAPLTDVHSSSMKVFVDENTAQFVEDIGISLDGLDADFSEMESVQVTPFYMEVAGDASKLKEKLSYLNLQLNRIKESIADEFDDYLDPKTVTDDEFTSKMALENISQSLVQRYLEAKEQKETLESRLGVVNREVYNETTKKIRLPKKLKENIYHDIF